MKVQIDIDHVARIHTTWSILRLQHVRVTTIMHATIVGQHRQEDAGAVSGSERKDASHSGTAPSIKSPSLSSNACHSAMDRAHRAAMRVATPHTCDASSLRHSSISSSNAAPGCVHHHIVAWTIGATTAASPSNGDAHGGAPSCTPLSPSWRPHVQSRNAATNTSRTAGVLKASNAGVQ